MNQADKWFWPTLCRVCHRWQGQSICTHCTHHAHLTAPRCHRCAVRVAPGVSLCQQCEDMPPAFDHALAAVDYELPWSPLVAALKFREDPALAKPLARLMAQSVKARWVVPPDDATGRAKAPLAWRRGAPSLIVPVPLSGQRLRERGYNQAWLLASQLGQQLQRPALADGLLKVRHTERLMSLDAHEREDHIRGAYAVNQAHRRLIENRHVAVVDDVLTTGATLNEVARTLWLAGASEVSVWVVARTPLPDQAAALAKRQSKPSPQRDACSATLLMA
jgi:ComF family protein